MKKNLLLSGIAALAILGLVGCNSQEPVQGEPPTEQEQNVEGNQEQPAEEQPAEEKPEEKKE